MRKLSSLLNEVGEDTRKWYRIVKGSKTGKMFLLCDFHKPVVEKKVEENNAKPDRESVWSLHQIGDGTTGMKLCFLCEKAAARG